MMILDSEVHTSSVKSRKDENQPENLLQEEDFRDLLTKLSVTNLVMFGDFFTFKFQFPWCLRSREEIARLFGHLWLKNGRQFIFLFVSSFNQSHLKEGQCSFLNASGSEGETFPIPGLGSQAKQKTAVVKHEGFCVLHLDPSLRPICLFRFTEYQVFSSELGFFPLESYRACLITANENGFSHTVFPCVLNIFNTTLFPWGKWPLSVHSPLRCTK